MPCHLLEESREVVHIVNTDVWTNVRHWEIRHKKKVLSTLNLLLVDEVHRRGIKVLTEETVNRRLTEL